SVSLRLTAFFPLLDAFHISSHPSSAVSAKSFTVRPFLLDLTQEFSSRSLYNLFSLIVSVFCLDYIQFSMYSLFDPFSGSMEANGFEPMTSCVQTRCSPN